MMSGFIDFMKQNINNELVVKELARQQGLSVFCYSAKFKKRR
jgi:transcriptional regulator GlxA family with amidase domain